MGAHSGFTSLSKKTYPGRFILLGTHSDSSVGILVYGITARSPSSQARKLVASHAGISVGVTDENLLKQGNPDLLVYNAITGVGDTLLVSNGAQTDLLVHYAQQHMKDGIVPLQLLHEVTVRPHPMPKNPTINLCAYEPDEPNYTPRISGAANAKGAALSILKRDTANNSDVVLASFYDVPATSQRGLGISTYFGSSESPIPSFIGEPFPVFFTQQTAQEVARDVYEALAPMHATAQGESGPHSDAESKTTAHPDYRVSVAVVFYQKRNGQIMESHIINRVDDAEENSEGTDRKKANGSKEQL